MESRRLKTENEIFFPFFPFFFLHTFKHIQISLYFQFDWFYGGFVSLIARKWICLKRKKKQKKNLWWKKKNYGKQKIKTKARKRCYLFINSVCCFRILPHFIESAYRIVCRVTGIFLVSFVTHLYTMTAASIASATVMATTTTTTTATATASMMMD